MCEPGIAPCACPPWEELSSRVSGLSQGRPAAEHVRQFADQAGKSDASLRVGVKGGGCSGLMYTLGIERDATDDDKVIEQHGIRIFIPKRSYVFLAGTTLDFSDGLNGKGFVFANPNASSTCGCGNSFAA